MRKVLFYTIIITLAQVIPNNLRGQSCGFGCLGLSGIYGGYSFQEYDANNLSDYLRISNPSNIETPEFSKGNGFKLGANIFRAKFDGFFISAKGFYQFLEENYEVEVNAGALQKEKYEFSTNYFGFGLDFGIDIVDVISLKLLEGGLTFHDAELKVTNTYFDTSVQDLSLKFTNDKLRIGYYLGTGLILHLIQDYVSIEGTAFFSFYNVDNLSRESVNNDIVYLLPEDSKTISSGGFGASVQLNIGFPF